MAWLRRVPPVAISAGLLALLIAVAAARYHDQNFMSARTLVDLLSGNAYVGVIAAGMTLVIIAGGIDLSVGAVMGLCNVLIAVLITRAGWPAWLALMAGPALGMLIGAGQGALIHWSRLPAFIVTLAGMFLARGAAYIVSLESVGIDDAGHAALSSAGVTIPLGGADSAGVRVSLTVMLLLAVYATGSYVLRWTSFGRTIYAVGGSVGGEGDAAGLMGLPVGRTKVLVYTISGACAGLAGSMLSLDLSSGSHTEGVGLELDAIAAVVIGGTLLAGGSGSVLGTLVGVLLMGLVVNVVTAYEGWLGSGMTKVVVAGLLAMFVLMQRMVRPSNSK